MLLSTAGSVFKLNDRKMLILLLLRQFLLDKDSSVGKVTKFRTGFDA